MLLWRLNERNGRGKKKLVTPKSLSPHPQVSANRLCSLNQKNHCFVIQTQFREPQQRHKLYSDLIANHYSHI